MPSVAAHSAAKTEEHWTTSSYANRPFPQRYMHANCSFLIATHLTVTKCTWNFCDEQRLALVRVIMLCCDKGRKRWWQLLFNTPKTRACNHWWKHLNIMPPSKLCLKMRWFTNDENLLIKADGCLYGTIHDVFVCTNDYKNGEWKFHLHQEMIYTQVIITAFELLRTVAS